MLRMELIEIDPLDGGVGYGGDYGGSGSLVLNEYIPPVKTAVTGELWMSFLNEPSKKPFKVADVAAGQKVQVPSLPDTPVRFYLVSNDPSGRKTVVNLNAARVRDVNVNKENKTPVIEQIGASTLDKIQIGIKGYTETVRYRKIQIGSSMSFSPGTYVESVKDFDGVVKIIGAVETLPRAFSVNEESRVVRVSHSTNGVDYGPWSNKLPITYRNEIGDGVPVLFNPVLNPDAVPPEPKPAKVSTVGASWLVEVERAKKNGYNVSNVQIRLLQNDPDFWGNTSGAHAADATELLVLNIGAFNPAGGKAYLEYGETISYTGISTTGGDKLIGVTRGVDGSTASHIPENTICRPILFEKDLGNQFLFSMPRLPNAYLLQIRQRNNYYDGGQQGWSLWGDGGEAVGTDYDPVEGPAPYVPPTPPPSPPVYEGAEDPFNPINDKYNGRNVYLDLSVNVQ